MNNETLTNSIPPVAMAAANDTPQQQWKGLTMDELRMRRAKQLVIREVNRASLNYKLSSMRNNVSQNGVRGVLFNNSTITGLKKADYASLGYKAVALLVKIFVRRRRR